MDTKISTYVCTGCGIGECVNAAKLVEVASGEFHLPAKARYFLCSPEGAEFLREDIKAEDAGRAVIAACSERVNWDVFSPESLGVEAVERVNIREQVAWTKEPNTEDTQTLAEDYIRMGIVKSQKTELPGRPIEAIEKTIMVVGGGITGITAALQATAAGADVILIEKEKALGGWLSRFHKLFPSHAPYQALEDPNIESRIQQVLDHPRIKVFTSSEIISMSGAPGAFQVSLRENGNEVPLSVGAVVMATGWEPYDATKLEHLGFGKSPNVITNVTLEELAKAGAVQRPSDNLPVKSVMFIQRAVAPGEGRFSYASGMRDMVTLKQALYLRKQNPDADVYIVYEDMVTPGTNEYFYRRVQEEPRVFFTKGEVANVTDAGDGDLMVDLKHSLIGEQVRMRVDLVVLAAGMVPVAMDSPTLNLLYRQGSELPATQQGFADSNYICFPYETRRTALYSAGSARQPMDVADSMEDATGAALKAIQSLELVSAGMATHPRAGDLSFPKIRLAGCTQCRRCLEECPFSVIEQDERGYPHVNEDRCRRCGICMGACPVQVISFDNYSVEQLSSVIRAFSVPEEEGKFRVLVLACENDAYPAFDMAGINRLLYDASVRIVPVRCIGSINMVLVRDALNSGVDGVLIMGCKSGDDYQCHFMTGSALAGQRMENVRETVQRMTMEPERVRSEQVEISDYDKIPFLIQQFVEDLKVMGPNPYKGF